MLQGSKKVGISTPKARMSANNSLSRTKTEVKVLKKPQSKSRGRSKLTSLKGSSLKRMVVPIDNALQGIHKMLRPRKKSAKKVPKPRKKSRKVPVFEIEINLDAPRRTTRKSPFEETSTRNDELVPDLPIA